MSKNIVLPNATTVCTDQEKTHDVLEGGTECNVSFLGSIAALEAEYAELENFYPKDNFERSIDWFDLLQQHVFTNDFDVRYYIASDQKKRLVALLPLNLTTIGPIKKIESLSNFYTSLYTPLLFDPSARYQLRQMLIKATQDFKNTNVMRFAPMDSESLEFHSLLADIRAIGWIPFQYFCFHNWYLRNLSSWENYVQRRSRNLRSNIKRRRRQFAAGGGHVDIFTGVENVNQAIAAFQEVYFASWKVPEPYPEFIPSLIRRLATLGMLRLGIAHFGEKAVAAQLWIVGRKKASIYKVAYRNDFSSYSPGTVLTSYLMEYVIQNDHVDEVDFLIGDDEYKKKWMSDRRERWGIVAYNPRTLLGLVLLLTELLGRSTKSIRRKVKSFFGLTKTSNWRNNSEGHDR